MAVFVTHRKSLRSFILQKVRVKRFIRFGGNIAAVFASLFDTVCQQVFVPYESSAARAAMVRGVCGTDAEDCRKVADHGSFTHFIRIDGLVFAEPYAMCFRTSAMGRLPA